VERLLPIYGTLTQSIVAFCSSFDTALEAGRLLAMKKYFILSICLGIVFFLNYIGYGLAFWYGSELISNSEITPGSVFTVSFLHNCGIINSYCLGNIL
jgi:ATP-binding cassette subfamily B (MDR/TAP) protein 1